MPLILLRPAAAGNEHIGLRLQVDHADILIDRTQCTDDLIAFLRSLEMPFKLRLALLPLGHKAADVGNDALQKCAARQLDLHGRV